MESTHGILIQDQHSYDICKKGINTIKDSSINLATILNYVDLNRVYLIGGYKSTAEFAKKEFDISKSTVSRLLNVMRKFGSPVKNTDYKKLGIDKFDALIKTCSDGLYEINPEYKDFDYTKLSLMTQLNEEHLKMCNPDLSYRQINQIYKAQTEKEKLEDKKKSLQNFDITADCLWYDKNDIRRIFKIGKNQIRSPAQLAKLNKLFKTDSYMEYTEEQKISIFAALAIKEKIERL